MEVTDFEPWRWSALNMDYMNKRPSRMQGQFSFLKSERVGREHGLHSGRAGGVPKADPTLGKCDLTRGLQKRIAL